MQNWSFVDEVWCIHLPERTDRSLLIDDLIEKTSLPIQIFEAKKHKNGSIQGCFESHKTIIQSALKRGLSNVMILEDDAELSPDVDWKILNQVRDFILSNRKKWDILYLGCFPDIWNYPQTPVNKNIFKVKATQTHAYIINYNYMNVIANTHFTGKPIDEVYKKNANNFAVLPSLFYQSISKSDVSSIEMISTLPFKNPIIKAVEIYSTYIGAISLRNFLILLICLCVVIIKYTRS